MNQTAIQAISDTPSTALLEQLIEEHQLSTQPRLRRLWEYYRNPSRQDAGGKLSHLAQEMGLPKRLARSVGGDTGRASAGREVVIENDIAWRIHTHVDFMFGKPLSKHSLGVGAQAVTASRGPA